MQENKKLLLVGQSLKNEERIRHALTGTEWEIESSGPSQPHLDQFSEQIYDVAVVELITEEQVLLLQNIKKHTRIPVLIIAAVQDEIWLKKALEQEADDFIISPVNPWEFFVRIEQLRKKHSSMKADICQMKSFSLDKVRRKVFLKSEENGQGVIELSHTEYMLLSMFVENQNVLLTYKDLYKTVWDSDSLDDVRTVKVHVSNLRKKIDPQDIGIIANVRRAGYIFTDL